MIKKLMKRTLSLVLALLMVFSIWPMSVWATEGENTPFVHNGVEIYTHADEGKAGYNDWSTYDGLHVDDSGCVRVSYTPGQEKSLLLKPQDNTIALTKGPGALAEYATLNSNVITEGMYQLLLSDQASGGGNAWVYFGDTNNGVDFMFMPETSGDQGGDNNDNQGGENNQPPILVCGADGNELTADGDRYFYTSGQETTLIFKAAADDITLVGARGWAADKSEQSLLDNGKSLKVVIPESVTGSFDIGVVFNGQNDYWFDFVDTNDMSDLYWCYMPEDGWRDDAIIADPGGNDWVYLATDREGTPLSGEISVSITPSVEGKAIGSVEMREGQLVWIRGENTAIGNEGIITVTCGANSYKIPVRIVEPWVGVYDSGGMLIPDADWNYHYTSGAETPLTFKIVEQNVSITKIEEIPSEWVSISGNTAIVTVPASASGELRFRVCWDEDGRQRDREYRFQDENPAFDIYWSNHIENDGWKKGALREAPGGSNNMYLSLDREHVLEMNPNTWTAGVTDGIGLVEITDDGRLYWDHSRNVTIGNEGIITISDGTNTYKIAVKIEEPWMCVYNTTSGEEELLIQDADHRYRYVSGTMQTYTATVPEDVTIIEIFNDTEINGLGNDYFSLNFRDHDVSFTIPAEMYGSFLLRVRFEGGGDREIFFEDVAQSDSRLEVKEDELTTEKEHYGPVPIGDTGYFIAPVGVTNDRINPMGGGYMMFHGDYPVVTARAVGLYKLAPDGVNLELLVGEELKAVVARFNGTLKMDVSQIAEDNDAGIQYPTTLDITESRDPVYYKLLVKPNEYPLAKLYKFSKYSAAAWCFTVTGTYTHLDGTTENIVAYGRDEYRLEALNNIKILEQENGKKTVEKVNEWLQNYADTNKDNNNYLVLQMELPAAVLEGYIEIPERVDEVIFRGSVNFDEHSENAYEIGTVLKGGIITHNEGMWVSGVRFEGSGRGTGTKENPNIGIRGTAGGEITHCSFTGYDCAVEMNRYAIGVSGMYTSENHIIDGTGSFFYDNDVAYRQNITTISGGDSSIRNTVMLGNGIDIEFAKIEKDGGWGASIEDTIFMRNGNQNSIHNTSGRTYYLPYGAFYNAHNEGNNGKQDPKVDGNVSIVPYFALNSEHSAHKDKLLPLLSGNTDAINAMLVNPAYYEDWVAPERLFPKNWKCPVEGDEDLYKVPADQVEETGMTIGMMAGEDVCANIKLKKAN